MEFVRSEIAVVRPSLSFSLFVVYVPLLLAFMHMSSCSRSSALDVRASSADVMDLTLCNYVIVAACHSFLPSFRFGAGFASVCVVAFV